MKDPHERANTRRAVLSRWKIRRGCQVCGFKAKYGCQLDLDHIDPMQKRYTLSNRSHLGATSWKTLKIEIGKCQVLCRNCHAARTYEEKHNQIRR